MGEDSIPRSLLDYLDEQANRPFGDVEAHSGRVLQPFSFAGRRAADNLLIKAKRALGDHDTDRARALVDRAARLPFDEHEKAAPVALAVHMQLFCVVADTIEESAQDDPRWLDAAVEVLRGAEEAAAYDLRDVLVAIEHDYALSPPEHTTIRAAVASIPSRAELRDLELTAAELGDHVMSILHARRDYDNAVAAATR
jgi:hypothetical protein